MAYANPSELQSSSIVSGNAKYQSLKYPCQIYKNNEKSLSKAGNSKLGANLGVTYLSKNTNHANLSLMYGTPAPSHFTRSQTKMASKTLK